MSIALEEEDFQNDNYLTLEVLKRDDREYPTFQEMYDAANAKDKGLCDWVIYRKVAPSRALAAFKPMVTDIHLSAYILLPGCPSFSFVCKTSSLHTCIYTPTNHIVSKSIHVYTHSRNLYVDAPGAHL